MTTRAAAFLTPPPPAFGQGHGHAPGGAASLAPPPPRRRRRARAVPPLCLALPPALAPRVLFTSIQTTGRRAVPEALIESTFAPLRGRRVPMADIEAALKTINAWLLDNHYVCSYVVLAKAALQQHNVLALVCVEPLLSAIRTVAVSENGTPEASAGVRVRTRSSVLLRCLRLRMGDVFRWDRDNLRQLSRLGLFTYVDAKVEIDGRDAVTLVLSLCESKSRFIEPGFGIATSGRQQLFGDLSVVDNNVRGRAQRLKLEWQKKIDAPHPTFALALDDRRVGAFIPLSFHLRAYRDCNALYRSAAAHAPTGILDPSLLAAAVSLPSRYEKDRDGVLLDIGYKPSEASPALFSVTPMVERIYGRSSPASLQTVLQTSYTLHNAGSSAARLPPSPAALLRSGHVIKLEHSLGAPLPAAPPRPHLFHKVKLKLINYLPVRARSALATRFVFALATDNLPWHEQKALGGHSTIRGFNYAELGRFRSFTTGRLELRVPLAFDSNSNSNSKNNNNTASQLQSPAPPDGTAAPDQLQQQPASGYNRLPALVGVVFADFGMADARLVGASSGVGVRVGGIMAVDWTSTNDNRASRLHFSLVDRTF